MLPIRTIRDPRAASRPERAERAVALLARMNQHLDVDPAIRWDAWEHLHDRMVELLTPEALVQFKSHPDLAPQICGGDDSYLTKVRELRGTETLSFFLRTFRETLCGDPPDVTNVEGSFLTRTSMRHIHYLSTLHGFIRPYFGAVNEVVEVGGGFGNLARLMLQYNLTRRHTIIDFPASMAIQYFFLGEFLDEADIAIWTGREYLAGSAASRVRLTLPNGTDAVAAELKTGGPSMLVSTMAMTEITNAGQDFYLSRLKPDAVYVSGQTDLDSINRSQALDRFQVLENRSLFYRLAEDFHPVEFRQGDYYTEFVGTAL
ncbi:MAG: putative sugar O-methyltransferase [Magnetospirillum sp.]|nr:MAG: putative sugar O-methyltransferase [Magnetospirillum sp.]